MQHAFHLLAYFGISRQFVEREQILFQIEVDIGLEISESDGVLELEVLDLGYVASALNEDIPVEVVYYVVQLLVHDLLHVDLNLRLKVIKSVEKGPDVPL